MKKERIGLQKDRVFRNKEEVCLLRDRVSMKKERNRL
jgi:hypothetical protein